MKLVQFAIALLLPFSASAHSSLAQQVDAFQAAYGHPTSNFQLLNKSSRIFADLEKPKVALKGVLYWGGADKAQARSQSAMSNTSTGNFCAEGFSHLYYIYKKNVGPSQVSCGRGTIPYTVTGQVSPGNSAVRAFMQTIYRIIKADGKVGPAYLHCWWGVHASNTFASIALKQFCGYSDQQAVAHWDRIGHLPDPNNRALSAAAKEENRNKIRNFQPYADLQITDAEQRLICF